MGRTFFFYGGVFMDTISKRFGDNLRAQRKKLGLTQQQIADELNIDRSTYSYYELGRTDPSIATLCKLTQIFGITADQLINPQPNE